MSGYLQRPAVPLISGIYGIFNVYNGKVYVGQSSDVHARWWIHRRRLNRGAHINEHLQAAWKVYGCDGFEFRLIEECACDVLACREVAWIAYYRSNDAAYGYNKDRGGGGVPREKTARGLPVGALPRRTRSEAAKLRGPRSLATRKKMSESAKRRAGISEETRAKLVEAQRRRRACTTVSAETRQKLAAAAAKRGTAYREKMSSIRKEWWKRQRARQSSTAGSASTA